MRDSRTSRTTENQDSVRVTADLGVGERDTTTVEEFKKKTSLTDILRKVV